MCPNGGTPALLGCCRSGVKFPMGVGRRRRDHLGSCDDGTLCLSREEKIPLFSAGAESKCPVVIIKGKKRAKVVHECERFHCLEEEIVKEGLVSAKGRLPLRQTR